MKTIKNLIIFLIFFSSFLYSQEKIVLQLKWFHQFQFAGYYAAKEKGFYKDLGLDVEIRQRDIKFNNIEQVIKGEAQYGVADSVLLLYKTKNKPVVIVSPIFQHSPGVLYTLKESGIDSPFKLDKKDLIFYANDTDGFSTVAMLKKFGIKPNLIGYKKENDYLKLINKQVDAIPGYLTNEFFYFKERNIDINIINPSNFGFDLYGDMLFTNENEAKYHPNRVRKFKEATLKGWNYALENKEEIISLIHKKYNKSKSLEHLRHEANAIDKLIQKDMIPLGTISEGRIKYISELYRSFGFISDDFSVKDFIFEEYYSNSIKNHLSKEELSFLENKKVLRVSNETDFAPFDFIINGIPSGFSIDLLNLLAKKLDIKIEYINGYTWNELVELFKKNELDLLHSLAITKQRESFGLFSKSYTRYQTHFVTAKSNPEIKTIEEIKDKTIVVGKDWAIEHFLKNNYPELKVISVNSLDEILDYVSSGKAYATILNKDVANYQIKKRNILDLKISNWCKEFDRNKAKKFHFFAQKDSSLLISSLNKALDSLTLKEINKLNEKWFLSGDSSNSLQKLTFKEQEFIEKYPSIKVRTHPNRPPFEFLENGKPVGIAIDYIRKSAENTGLNMDFVIDDSPIKDVYEHIKNSREKYDTLIMSVKSKKREEDFSYGKAFLSYPMMIITHKNSSYISSLSDLNNKTVVIEKSYLTNKWIKKDYPLIKIINVKDTVSALEMINEGKADAYVGNLAVANYMYIFKGMDNLKIAAPSGYGDVKFSFIAPKQWPELASILSKGYDSISPSEHTAIQQRWFSFQTIEKIDYSLMWKILFVVFMVILWFLWWSRRLLVEKNKTQKALKELKKVQEEKIKQQQVILEQSRIAAMGEMIGNIAHQWRQPLSAISVTASGLKLQKDLDILEDKNFDKSMESILKNTQYLSDTIDTFRHYITFDKTLESLVLEDVVKDALDIALASLSNHHITLENNINYENRTKVSIIHSELVQVVMNIINNAKDALLENNIKNPSIKVSLEEKESNVTIIIEDNAGGVPPDIIDKIFDPYFTTKHQSQGTGLGLNMSFKIVVESLLGKLFVKNSDKGAIFYIELPKKKS